MKMCSLVETTTKRKKLVKFNIKCRLLYIIFLLMDLMYKTNITGDPAVDFDHAAHPYGDVMGE